MTLHPDAYPSVTVRPQAPAVSAATQAAVVHASAPPVPVRRPAAPARHAAPKTHRHARPAEPRPRPAIRLPFPTLAIKWFSGVTGPAGSTRHDVPKDVALVLAALVLASAVFLAGAARAATR